jgi:hypothetical protein
MTSFALFGSDEEATTVSVPTKPQCSGIWSSEGIAMAQAGQRIRSPDGKHFLNVKPEGVWVEDSAGASRPIKAFVDPALTEIVWSPDSTRVAFSVSDGGMVGTWATVVSDLSVTSGQDIELTPEVLNAGPFAQCPEAPNLGVVGWLDGGEQLLLVEEVPPHSSCQNMGALRGYKYNMTTRKVSETLPKQTLLQHHAASLGCRLFEPMTSI